MATLWVTALLILLATVSEARSVGPTLLDMTTTRSLTDHPTVQALSVFEKGTHEITAFKIPKSDPSAPPQPLFVVWPNTAGKYPILLFIHGTFLQNTDYSDLFEHIASHGYVVVAPQLWLSIFLPSHGEEIEMAALVANWLSTNLQTILPIGVEGDLSKLAVSGHSRGGKTAFALALGMSKTKLEVEVSALIGVDPVAGPSKRDRTKPYVLTYVLNSFNLSIPTMVIGTGLGNRSLVPFITPACAPNEVNYVEFFNECKSGTKFVVTNYGHMDMLNDNLSIMGSFARVACVKGNGGKGPMRRTVGGLVVAYLDASFLNDPSEYVNIITDPSLAPAKLYPIEIKTQGDEARYYSQVSYMHVDGANM